MITAAFRATLSFPFDQNYFSGLECIKPNRLYPVGQQRRRGIKVMGVTEVSA